MSARVDPACAGPRALKNPKPRVASASWLVAAGLLFLPGRATVVIAADEPAELGDVMEGWDVFHEKRCAHCHAVWGQGGEIGPDLGRTYRGHLSASELAGNMWNHVPRMQALMRQYKLPDVMLTRAEMADVFSFLYFIRYLDEPGDPHLGSLVLEQKKCTECHDLVHGGGGIAPDLTRWAGYVNPIVWAQLMWKDGVAMEVAMEKRNMEWPDLEDDDLANIIAFVRSVGKSDEKVYLQPGSPGRGKRLFTERACAACHSPGSDGKLKAPDLSRIELPNSFSALASRMWNHSPKMRKLMTELDIKLPALTPQEMADIIAFVFAMQYEGDPGDPARGKRFFEQNRCEHCHTLVAPPNGEQAAAGQASPVGMGEAIWRHGARMVEQMNLAGIPWPTFKRTDMADLISYLESAGRIKVKPQFAGTANAEGADEAKPK